MSDPFVGEIRMFGGNFAPAGWMFCSGDLLAVSEYDTLFNLIGTTYGGDGQNTFALPDLRSRFPMHQGSWATLGALGGTATVTLTAVELAAHSHSPVATSTAASTANPQNGTWAAWSDTPYSPAEPTSAMAALALTSSGGTQPHENMPPYLAVSFIISVFGIYPSPS
jgi:microcystin-dependent protein